MLWFIVCGNTLPSRILPPDMYAVMGELADLRSAMGTIRNVTAVLDDEAYRGNTLLPLSSLYMNEFIYGDGLAKYAGIRLDGCSVTVLGVTRTVLQSYAVDRLAITAADGADRTPARDCGDPSEKYVAIVLRLDVLSGPEAGETRFVYLTERELAESCYDKVESTLAPGTRYRLHGGALKLDRSIAGLWASGMTVHYTVFACPQGRGTHCS